MLPDAQKQTRLNIFRVSLELLQEDPDRFFSRFITMDETWLHHYNLETKLQSMLGKNYRL